MLRTIPERTAIAHSFRLVTGWLLASALRRSGRFSEALCLRVERGPECRR
jgi:hypothetical protein